MKTMITVLTFLMAANALAQVSCLGEAQFIAQAATVTKQFPRGCLVQLDAQKVSQFSSSAICPLSFEEVQEKGILVGFKDGHDCLVDVGETFSGVIVKKSGGDLFLE